MSEYVKSRGQLRHELSQIVETFGYEAVANELLYGDFRTISRSDINSVSRLPLKVRTVNALARGGILSISQLTDVLNTKPDTLLNIRDFGVGMLNEVKAIAPLLTPAE